MNVSTYMFAYIYLMLLIFLIKLPKWVNGKLAEVSFKFYLYYLKT